MKINYDYWWLVRQQWIESMQPKRNAETLDLILWMILGLIVTACLMVW